MNEVWSARYSPADLPSRWRAAPAKKRIWSTIGGISSARVTATGLPVLALSTATRSSARASRASAIRNKARLLTDGLASRQPGKAAAAAPMAVSTSLAPDTGDSRYSSPVLGSTSRAAAPSFVATYVPPTKFERPDVPVPPRSELWLLTDPPRALPMARRHSAPGRWTVTAQLRRGHSYRRMVLKQA